MRLEGPLLGPGLCAMPALVTQGFKLFAQAGFPAVQIIAKRLTPGFEIAGKLSTPGSDIRQ